VIWVTKTRGVCGYISQCGIIREDCLASPWVVNGYDSYLAVMYYRSPVQIGMRSAIGLVIASKIIEVRGVLQGEKWHVAVTTIYVLPAKTTDRIPGRCNLHGHVLTHSSVGRVIDPTY